MAVERCVSSDDKFLYIVVSCLITLHYQLVKKLTPNCRCMCVCVCNNFMAVERYVFIVQVLGESYTSCYTIS